MKNFKKFIDNFKKNENNVSMVLGIIVILIVGLFIIKNYQRPSGGEIAPSVGTEDQEGALNKKYSVQKGDDLWKISEKFLNSGYEWKKIADLNNLKPPYTIEVGQELLIPFPGNISGDGAITENTISPTATPITTQPSTISEDISNPIETNTYVVVKGDNLWNIAIRAYGDGYRWIDIAKANNLINPDLIHRGNVFVIPR